MLLLLLPPAVSQMLLVCTTLLYEDGHGMMIKGTRCPIESLDIVNGESLLLLLS